MNKMSLGIFILLLSSFNLYANQERCNGRNLDPQALLQGIRDAEQASYLLNAELATGGEQEETGEETRRFQLFRFEKDYNQKNVLHYGININVPSCTIAHRQNGAPSFNTYWILGEKKGQRQNPTKSDLDKLGPRIVSHDDHSVRFSMKALNEIDINNKQIEVRAEIVNGECQVRGYVDLNDGREISLTRIFANISTVIGIPTGVSSIRVEGRNSSNNQPVSLTFDN